MRMPADARSRIAQSELLQKGLKHCPRCATTKDVAGFNRNAARYDGLAIWCRPCMAEYQREYNKRKDVKARAAKRSLAYYHLLSVDEKLALQEKRRKTGYHFRRYFNITLERYDQMVSEQGGVCAICRKPPSGKRARLVVDHDHACCPESGRSCGACVRGLLCVGCNVKLSPLENREWRSRAEAYISEYSDREIQRIEGGTA